MHVLFVHQNYPAEFGHIADQLSRKPGYRCTFVSQKPGGTLGDLVENLLSAAGRRQRAYSLL